MQVLEASEITEVLEKFAKLKNKQGGSDAGQDMKVSLLLFA